MSRALGGTPRVRARTLARRPTLGDVVRASESSAAVAEGEWAALLRSVGAGDQGALHALYERAHAPVFTLAARITGSRRIAEEVTLEVFHDIWHESRRYEPAQGTVLGWIMNRARSRALLRLRPGHEESGA
ncbi:MAG TPA: sigma factor [Burkholderiales bacterium]|nr:sigma factor [Burkholderiales bacterium]